MKIDAAARRTQFVGPGSTNFLAVVRNQIRDADTDCHCSGWTAGRMTERQTK